MNTATSLAKVGLEVSVLGCERMAKEAHADTRCCHLLTQIETSIGWFMSSAPLAKGGVRPLARVVVASARIRACAWAPSRPPSSKAKGKRMWGSPRITEMGCVEVRSAKNFLSSACLAAYHGIVATFSKTVFMYTVVKTASMTMCLPSAKKSKATTSPGLERSAARRPLASSTTDASGTPASRKMVLMTPTRPAWKRWRIPPFGHLTTWRSSDFACLAWIPHWGQCCRAVCLCLSSKRHGACDAPNSGPSDLRRRALSKGYVQQ